MTLRNILLCGLPVLTSLSVACGDPGPATFGVGSTGSSGSGGATSTTSGAESTTASSTSDGAGGAGGAGLCSAVTCSASDECHLAGTCDETTGTCSNPDAPDGTACTGPNVCTAATCQAAVCTPGAGVHGAVDQSQLTGNPGLFIRSQPQQSVGQTFVVGTAGHLTGIEVSLSNCATPPNGSIRLDVRDAAHQILTSASLSTSALASGCSGGGNLGATSTGQAYFDLSAACLNVSAGDSLELEMFAVNFPVATCDTISLTCNGGPNAGGPCTIAAPCSQFRVDVGENADGTSYTAGTELANGATYSGDQDIAFKTYIE